MTVADRWLKEAETWDASDPDAVDRRLAQCNTLLHLAREAVATEGIGPGTRKHLAAIVDLEATQGALNTLRHDLLTAASDREWIGPGDRESRDELDYSRDEHPHGPGGKFDEHGRPVDEGGNPLDWQGNAIPQPIQYRPSPHGGYEASPFHESSLSSQDRRYVALESAKFLSANSHCPPDELAIRARHHAELQTSTFPAERSRRVTAAFVGKVVELHRDLPRPRVASRPVPDLPDVDELMFL